MRSSLVRSVPFLALICVFLARSSDAFSQENDSLISRRDYWKVSLGVAGGVAYGKLVGDTLLRISQGIERPKAHEERVEAVITRALLESAKTKKSPNEPFRILEVGIGTDCRLIRRGLYNNGLDKLASRQISYVELTGTDVMLPSKATIENARALLSKETRDFSMNVDFNTVSGDISAGLSYSAGYFDSVLCCLTLCSVSHLDSAIREMKRLVRPNGGTFGYVEHVAVDSEEPYRFLEWQQEFFDPLQRKLADNCHLHRYTENAINKIFTADDESALGVRLQCERFLVDDMWPVTCQASGVIQMNA